MAIKLSQKFVFPDEKYNIRKILCALVLLLFIVWGSLSYYFSLSPIDFIKHTTKSAGYYVFSVIYQDDLVETEKIIKNYYIGNNNLINNVDPLLTWKALEEKNIKIIEIKGFYSSLLSKKIPFIYEDPNSLDLRDFRERYFLNNPMSGLQTEYSNMLSLIAFMGTRWEHGTDVVPGGAKIFDLNEIIEAGENGKKFWCEIAAESAVKAASAMGWPARLVTLSRDGYKWEHAVAEFWSNEYKKWFVVDTDFNVLFKKKDIPLSAWELCHYGNDYQKSGQLEVFHFAPPKNNLPYIDLLPYFSYIHIDLRNDWRSRILPRGSPAGGELSTWWTARDAMHPIFTIEKRVDDKARFNWPVNVCAIYVESLKIKNNEDIITLELAGYSPYFENWMILIDDGTWQDVNSNTQRFPFKKGIHTISARIKLKNGFMGLVSSVKFEVK